MATVPAVLSEPIVVANLPLPPEIAAAIEARCHVHRYNKRDRVTVMEDAKVRYHYAGHFLIATEDRHGMKDPRHRP